MMVRLKYGITNPRIKTRFLILALCLFATGNTALAQLSRTVYKTQLLYDTIVASSNRDYLFNNITITNLTRDKISVLVNIEPPPGWNMITQKVQTVSLNANENTQLTIRLIPGTARTASWQKVKIEYRLNSSIETTVDTFGVKVQEFKKFKAFLPRANLVLSAYQKNITFPLSIKNTGNVPNDYSIHFENDLLQLDYSMVMHLDADSDTVYSIPLRLTEAQWDRLLKESIKITVTGGQNETYNLSQNISRIGSSLKENASAFLDMPLQLETGISYTGNETQFYESVTGSLDITRDDRLSYEFRSNTYSTGQTVKNNIVRAEYTGKHWFASGGNINTLTDFLLDGYGIKAGRTWGRSSKLEVYTMLQSRTGDSKVFGLNSGIDLSEKVRIGEEVTTNLDNIKKVNSFIFRQTADFRLGNNGKLSLRAGIGAEQSFGKLAGSGTPQTISGPSLGYNLQYATKKFSVGSSILYNSDQFPGFLKGQTQQIHDGRLIWNNFFGGGFYEYSYRKQTYFTDTALFSNVFNLQTANYGIRTGWNRRNNSFGFALGRQEQLLIADTLLNKDKYLYSYFNINLTMQFFKHLTFTTVSSVGSGNIENKHTDSMAFVTTNQGTLAYLYKGGLASWGIAVRYDYGPYYYNDYLNYLKKPEKYERAIYSPYIDLRLLKEKLSIRGQFNMAVNNPGNAKTSNVIGNVAYINALRGYDVGVSAVIPIKQLVSTPFINASIRVRLHTPFVFIRKFYNMKLVLFKDVNSNGKLDEGEELIKGQSVAINDNVLVSGQDGSIAYRNISKGTYKVDFGLTSKMKGWIPAQGMIQNFALSGNANIYIPYKLSRILQGKLNLVVDSNSNITFNLANIRVEATSSDSTGNYSTLTDENGEFYFNLPAGNYDVKLSDAAFDENFRPTIHSQPADLVNNNTKTVYFEIKQRKRTINIKKKK